MTLAPFPKVWRRSLQLSLAYLSVIQASLGYAEEQADPLKAKRCATRLSIAILGTSPSPPLLQNPNPQSQVDQLLADPLFQERFARFINAKFNDDVGTNSEDDAAYHMTKHVLQSNLPWKEMFVGPFTVEASGTGTSKTVSIRSDNSGLGYFRSRPWLARYAGNEATGLKIATAYRMMNNVVGLNVSAVTTAPGADVSATGRAAAPCKTCHFDNWYALDKASQLLSRVVRNGNAVSFTPADGQPKEVLGGLMLRDDKEFVNALVESQDFLVHTCRLTFGYLYGRKENACEAKLFDACVESLTSSGSIVSALSTVAKDSSFCQ